jgi:hypothetical protein
MKAMEYLLMNLGDVYEEFSVPLKDALLIEVSDRLAFVPSIDVAPNA